MAFVSLLSPFKLKPNMLSRFFMIIFVLSTNCKAFATDVHWVVSSAGRCSLNDTISGLCASKRTIQCVVKESERIIPDYYCANLTSKPLGYLKCDNCPGRCVTSTWSSWQPCDVACARTFRFRTRSILWKDVDSVTCPTLLEKSPCPECAGSAQSFYFWRVGEWGSCHVFTKKEIYTAKDKRPSRANDGGLCGRELKIGQVTRTVKCIDTNGVEKRKSLCMNAKDKDGRITQEPEQSMVCHLPCDCHMSTWSTWNKCPGNYSLRNETRTRKVLYPPRLGGRACGALVETRPCSTKCPEYKWFTTAWGQCDALGDGASTFESTGNISGSRKSTRCGNGLQQRIVFCIVANTNLNSSELVPVGNGQCDDTKKPVDKQLCRIPCSHDCVVSSWSDWRPCSISCGSGGMKSRVRRIVRPASHGGHECPSLIEMAPCFSVPCTSWTKKMWSGCMGTGRCGAGKLHRTVYCVSGGQWVDDSKCTSFKPPVVYDCMVPCPKDCVISEWSNWGECSKSCGKAGGVQIRERSILANASKTRRACPTVLKQRRRCNMNSACQDEMAYMWKMSEWGTCTKHVNRSCGLGMAERKRTLHCGNGVKNFANDTRCGNLPMPAIVKNCDVPCPQNCEVSRWSKWSKCNATCSSKGIEISTRFAVQLPSNGGLPCPPRMIHGMETKTRACTTAAEACYEYSWSSSDWTHCQMLPQAKLTQTNCGNGYQTRVISCVRSDGELVDNFYCLQFRLQMPPIAIRSCWQPCSDHCVRSSWSKWYACPSTCTRDAPVRYRMRQVVNLSPARGGFSATCPKLSSLDFEEKEPCPKMPCKSYKWSVSSFGSCIPHNRVTSCGEGSRERHVFCRDRNDLSLVADSFCDKANKPTFYQRCVVECDQDCIVSPWGNWDRQCSSTCGETVHSRNRSVVKKNIGLGRNCPSLFDKQLCREEPCSFFKWKVGIWKTCAVNSRCGNGTQTRQVTCSPDPARDWLCSRQAPKPLSTKTCSLPCPGDCVMSEWSSWSNCAKGKYGCVTMRRRQILRKEHATSAVKCYRNATEETAKCKCQSEGVIAISNWTSCLLHNKTGPDCGEGVQHRSVICEGDNGKVLDDKYCSTIEKNAKTRPCKVSCPVDCFMGNWGEWSHCTKSCGLDAQTRRFRRIIVSGQNGGRKCPVEMQTRPCHVPPCFTYRLNDGKWGKCYVDGRGCGRGLQEKETTCVRSDGEVVGPHFCFGSVIKSSDVHLRLNVLRIIINNSSQLSITSSRSCDVACPGDCVMSDWSEWSECERSCFSNTTEYQQTRTRVVIFKADAGGKACSSDLLQTQKCQTEKLGSPCIGTLWKTSPWYTNGTRTVWCETSNGINVTGGCAMLNKPSVRKICTPSCADSNSQCENGVCVCKLYYELFNGECIPVNGCLRDTHCVSKHQVCRSEKCSCADGFAWNASSSSCELLSINEKTITMTTKTLATMRKTETTETTTEIETDVMLSTTASPQIDATNERSSSAPSSKKSTITTTTKATKNISVTITQEILNSPSTENPDKKAIYDSDDGITNEFWKWIGIGIGALVFFLVLAVGFYCYSRRNRKAKHKMMKLKRNTIELVGVVTYSEEGKTDSI